jgi:hypothetical protein
MEIKANIYAQTRKQKKNYTMVLISIAPANFGTALHAHTITVHVYHFYSVHFIDSTFAGKYTNCFPLGN